MTVGGDSEAHGLIRSFLLFSRAMRGEEAMHWRLLQLMRAPFREFFPLAR